MHNYEFIHKKKYGKRQELIVFDQNNS
jgi:hypothetical protein